MNPAWSWQFWSPLQTFAERFSFLCCLSNAYVLVQLVLLPDFSFMCVLINLIVRFVNLCYVLVLLTFVEHFWKRSWQALDVMPHVCLPRP